MTTAVSSEGDVKPTISGVEQVVDMVSSDELAELSICESLHAGELLTKGLRHEERRSFFTPVLLFFPPL